ncbi:MAG: ABC transporter permease [Chloroflexota bacterium]
MQQYAIRRLIIAVPTILVMSLFVFGILRILPGDVARLVLGEGEGVRITTTSLEVIRKELGLDRPLPIQYLKWVWNFVRGDMGRSLTTRRLVTQEILIRIPFTLQLGVMAISIGLLVGIPVGIVCAVKQNSWMDYVLRFWSIFFLSAPGFWLGLMFLLLVVRFFDWSPPVGYSRLWEDPKNNLLQLIWPAMIMGSQSLAFIARMTRSSMLEVIREDYIRTARAKGLAEQVVIMRHALKNALIPIVTVAGTSLGHTLGGTVIMEQIFNIPGMGRLFLTALLTRDYTVIQGVVMLTATGFVIINLLVDLLYGWLDPRISYT